MNEYFEKINVNPKEWKREGDCVVRALTKASNKNWITVYDELCELGRKHYRMPNSKPIYEEWLKQNNFIKYKQPKKSNGKKFTVKELLDKIEDTPYLKGRTFVVSTNKHLTCIQCGKIKDTWDCGRKYEGNYWVLDI